MKVLAGYTRVNYVSKKSGHTVKGYQLTILRNCEVEPGDENGCGLGTVIFAPRGNIPYISDKVFERSGITDLWIGQQVTVAYNEYGQIDSINLA